MNTKTVVLRSLCWPLYFGTLIARIVHALWGDTKKWANGVLVTTLSPTSWPMNPQKKWGGWYRNWGGTCFGFGIMLAPGQSDVVLQHEEVHVEQGMAAAIGGLLFGLLVLAITHSWGGLVAFFACWMFSGAFAYIGASFAAWLRSEPNAYRGNHLEEAAYNATDVKCRTPASS
jgi:hypothetical protein